MFIALWTLVAAASPGYPARLESELGTACTPVCTVCHQTLAGGNGTAVQDFALAMRDRGLTGGSSFDLLVAALAQIEADGVDSDGDGIIDVDELRNGDDPNPGGVTFCDTLTPVYGCFNQAQVPVAALGAALAFAAARRRG